MWCARVMCVIASLLSVPVAVSVASADFRTGVEAYRRGDDVTALREFWSLAQQGHSGAEFNLGVLYARGLALPQDVVQAAHWYQRAARRGHAMAQCNLGVLFEEGEGVVQSDVEAVRWYRLSAEQGNAGGQNNLARMYEHGRGVAQDIGASLMWYRRAADQGNGQAQASLGRLYYEGKGVRQDDVAAHSRPHVDPAPRRPFVTQSAGGCRRRRFARPSNSFESGLPPNRPVRLRA